MKFDQVKYHKDWYQRNKDSQKEKMDEWRKNNKEKNERL